MSQTVFKYLTFARISKITIANIIITCDFYKTVVHACLFTETMEACKRLDTFRLCRRPAGKARNLLTDSFFR